MPVSARRALGAVVAAVGIVLALLGAWIVVKLGPSGEAGFTVTSKAPGAIVVTSDVLNSVDVPVRVKATRRDGGAVRLATAADTDAQAVLAGSAVSTVSRVRYPDETLDLRSSGTGPLKVVSNADVWRRSATGAGSAAIVVDQSRAPESAVVTSGDATALNEVTMTLTWQNQAWFFEALIAAMLGAVIAVFALNFLWQARDVVAPGDVAGTKRSAATT